ncbi:HAD family hydrolase [Mycoplasma sp. 3686d]|uniref:HAD family hydrolase n=1 Tax=Mycoplasma sp. 3686d TaxID=2967300 RepID=UPI00211C34AA|nr:HAD family hydrolase [Mycoplasma sp. 3686d]UUM24465.1 HAD family hydrolase [Mycoplasma sp. 3686d]
MVKLKNSDYDYLFFDLDGTLLNSKKQILPSSQQIIESQKKLNKKMSIITGRPPYLAKEEFLTLDLHYPVICCNGALIYDFKNNQIIDKNPINVQSAQAVFDILINNNVTFLIYTTKMMLGFHNRNSLPKWFEWIISTNNARKPQNQFHFEQKTYAQWNQEQFNINEHEIVKFLVIKSDSEPKDYVHAATQLKEVNHIYMINSQERVFDIMPSNISKGQALQKLAQLYNIDLNKTIVFGDEENDVAMFKVAKYSVAMGQSKDFVKQHAQFITDSNDNDGIYNFLTQIGENETR